MRMKQDLFTWLVAIVVFCVIPVAAHPDSCIECHGKQGVTVKVPRVAPIRVLVDGKERAITLDGAYKFHGHECPGMTIGYLAIQHGINTLFRDTVPAREDLLVTSRTSAAGVKDLIDLVMKGEKASDRTWPPPGMKNSREGFEFNIVRKSTCEAVQVRLNQEYFPADFYPLKGKVRNNTITDEEWQRLHGYMKNMIVTYPVKPAEELFGKPQPYKVILWGTLQPGEVDKSIRRMRQEEKKRTLQRQGMKP